MQVDMNTVAAAPPTDASAEEKAKAVLAAIIRAAGGTFQGTTRLYMAFYVAHLLHHRDEDGFLSDHPIARSSRGPAVASGERLLNELEAEGVLRRSRNRIELYVEDLFTLVGPGRGLSREEAASVAAAAELVRGRSAANLSEWMQVHSNAWNDTPDGEPMNVYVDLLSESEYAELKRRHAQAGELVNAAFA